MVFTEAALPCYALPWEVWPIDQQSWQHLAVG